MKLFKLIAAITVIMAGCSKDKADDNTSLNSSDILFAQEMAYANRGEIVQGGIAVANGNLDTVKMFGQMMITDHNTAQSELETIANGLGLQLPATTDSARQATATLLQSLSGDVFDTTYIGTQVRDHKSTIAFFHDEITFGNNRELINYANNYLPMMQAHLQEAEDIDELLH